MPSQAVLRWFASFAPHPVAVSWRERLRSCFGALLGIVATGAATHWLFGPQAQIPFLIAPMGASAVLLFGVPASPLAQPWSFIGGNLVAATVGVLSAMWIDDPIAAAALALAAATCVMFALRCIHPPSGAVALTAVLGGPAIHAFGLRGPRNRGLSLWRDTSEGRCVDDLMTPNVRTVDAHLPVADLIPVFAHYGHHHIPVVDGDRRLIGMITQADLIGGLHRQTQTRQLRTA